MAFSHERGKKEHVFEFHMEGWGQAQLSYERTKIPDAPLPCQLKSQSMIVNNRNNGPNAALAEENDSTEGYASTDEEEKKL